MSFDLDAFRAELRAGIPDPLPPAPPCPEGVSHAPARPQVLTPTEQELAVKNALRYLPAHTHAEMAPELARELLTDGRIYIRRLRPATPMKARPLDQYPARTRAAAAIMHMIQNNLDPAVAQHPHELVTYGGTGAVFQNWAQYRLVMRYLSEMTDEQTLVLYSGHPLGLFPSSPDAPRVVVTNGMVIPNYSSRADYDRMTALGVSSYGQMTAGSFMYIGPQGIVHGTTLTLINAARRYLGRDAERGLDGVVYVTSGLGGMSGAQAKAATIAGAVGVIAEIDPKALHKRLDQGWLMEASDDLDVVVRRLEAARNGGEALSLGYLGNVVDLWERLASAGVPIELGSDQTSLHNPFLGGYYPVGMSFEAANAMMVADPAGFEEAVRASLRRQIAAIDTLAAAGMRFWDYGNAFLLEASRSGATSVLRPDGGFTYPSYVEDIMGPMCFDLGFGPFRWVCTSADPADLATTDRIAADVLARMLADAPAENRQQLADNLRWIRDAEDNALVVGSQARILYADRAGRVAIALAFNRAIADGTLTAPVVLGRDHHDVSGTDSPFRETANIYDGSRYCADMAVHNVIGDSFRGATWVSLHNGGGVGWGEVINGGFGLVLDGSDGAARGARAMLDWDVSNGLARRAWARNDGAIWATQQAMASEPGLHVTLPALADDALVAAAVAVAREGRST
ncbi:MAG: urocanate hydratase [Deltaproteobacteria bacterium HGW-Deltaproteobacteria-14]|jgi:urocanate hydratase|nr:MAG: urocanate hydratase [Deltaproteobacteria bacterium HGW-Deltaproteobacteria-14]